MIIKNIDSMPQKKLKKLNLLFNILYFAFAFIAPIITIIVMTYITGDIKEGWKFPIVFLIIIISIILFAIRALKNKVKGIKILNIDGSYNDKMRTFKHIMLFISSALFPIVIILVTGAFSIFLKEAIEFYLRIIIITLSFNLIGIGIDKLVLSEIEEEIDIRDKLAVSNAIERRKNELMK